MKNTTGGIIAASIIGISALTTAAIASAPSSHASAPQTHVATVKADPPKAKGLYPLFWPSNAACAPLMQMTVAQLMKATPEARNHEALCEDWDIATRVSG